MDIHEARTAALPQFVKDGVELKKAVDALLLHAEQTYALFLDSDVGWAHLVEMLEQHAQKEASEKEKTLDQVMRMPLVHGKGTPDKDAVGLHRSTLGERITACKPNGQNQRTLGNLCVVWIIAFWEDRTRNEIAHALGIGVNDVCSDLFGDLNKLRNIILHAGGRMDERARTLKTLTWFSEGELVVIDSEKLHTIIELIRHFPNGLKTVGYDPVKRMEVMNRESPR